MSHRVVNLQVKATSKTVADRVRSRIEKKLDTNEYSLYDRSVSDGKDDSDFYTVGSSTEHNIDSEAKDFGSWLTNLIESEKASYTETGNLEDDGVCWMRYKVHDCWHNVDGVEEDCEAQDYKIFDLRP